MTNVNHLAKIINIDIDLDVVTIGNEKFTNCSLRKSSDLSQWLYCVLHTGNPSLLHGDKQEQLTEQIQNTVVNGKSILFGDAENIQGLSCVNLGGVRVYSEDGKSVAISKCRPNLTPGFFLYMNSVADGEILSNTDRYYIYADEPSKAIEIWSSIVEKLESISIPFTTKVLSQSSSYPRTDAVVVYSIKEFSNEIRKVILDVAASKYPNDFEQHTSPLCKVLTNVVSFAQQPKYRGKNVSFGESRCENIAYAIKDSIMTGLDFQMLLRKRFENAGINPDKIFEEL
ncbi:TPA: T3SS effector HopA1 family protein [Streptococcus suis]